MLPLSKRLTTKSFSEIMEKGKSVHSAFFLLRYLSTGKPNKYAAISSKKISKTAVARNKDRRSIYEAVASIDKAEKLKPGYSCLIFMKKPATEASFDVLKSELKNSFVKAGIL